MGKNTYAKNMAQRELRSGRWVSVHPKCQHGRRSGYSRYGCRCESCCHAEDLYRASLKTKPIPDELHGTVAGRQRGCGNSCCENASRAYDAARGSSAARLGLAKPPMPKLSQKTELVARMWLKYDRATRRWITTAPQAKHGSLSAYVNLGCRCPECEAAVPHGTTNGYYNYRCRCTQCQDAQHADYLAGKGQDRTRHRRPRRDYGQARL